MGSSMVSSKEVTWGPAGSSRELVPSLSDLARRLPTGSSDCREKVRLDLGLVLPSQPQAACLIPGLLVVFSHVNRFVVLKFAARGPGASCYLLSCLERSEWSFNQKEVKSDVIGGLFAY